MDQTSTTLAPERGRPIAAPEPAALSVVVCTLDEAEAIDGLITEIQSALEGLPHEIIVVDDDSSDGTGAKVEARAASDPRIRLIVRKGVRGLASAAVRGWDAANGAYLALIDGDGQHDPRLLGQLLQALRSEGADIAVASRYASEGPSGLKGRRAAISRAGTLLAGLVLRAPLTDPLSGCFVMRRGWYEAARPKLSAVGFKILFDLAASSPGRVRVAEVPTALRARQGGVSKLDARVIADLGALLVEKLTRGVIPARFVLFAAVGASGVAVNLILLWEALRGFGLRFWLAQAFAISWAMVWNFALNNILTFRDQRLRGWALLRGFVGFCGACAAGAVLNELIAEGLHRIGAPGLWAALTGAVAAGVFNFWAVRHTSWAEARPPNPHQT